MFRRSSRLLKGGYYNSDEESDSNNLPNKYRESPVKVFKKKAGPRKAGSRTSSRANSATTDPVPSADDVSPSASSTQSETTMRTVPYTPATATPRPALTPSLSSSHTPARSPPVPPETAPHAGLCSSVRPGLHFRPNPKNQSQSGVDSSGYSSSEGAYKAPSSSGGGATRVCCRNGAPCIGYTTRIRNAFFRLMGESADSACLMVEASQSRVMQLASLAGASLSGRMRKAFGLSLLLTVVLLCIWFLLPLFTSFFSRMTVMKNQSLTKPETEPVLPPAPPSQPSTTQPTPVLDPTIVSAVVEAKMQHFLVELRLEQNHFLTQMQERLQLDLKKMRENIEALNSDARLRLEEQVSGFGRQMEDHQSDSRSAAASLSLRIQAMEAQNAKLSQELSSIQLSPPVTVPCPDPDPAPVQTQLPPELQQNMEKWLTDRIKEHEAIRGSDCGRPMADKMADFALETQGASVISTRCSETYRIRSACVTLFGFPLWYPSESPRTVIQGYPVLLPGKCWAFHGVQGTLVISLSHPIRITHVTVDHLPRYNSPTGRINSAPKDFQIYGMKNDTEEGTLLGTFTYNENGESTQTFQLHNPSDVVYRCVELRVLSNWGHIEYTCLYRFRVHGTMAST